MWVGLSVAQKQMCQISGRGLIGTCQGIVYCAGSQLINNNGPAIWGGCVTRRKHRAGSWYFSQKTVTVQGGYGTCFCCHGTNLIAYRRDRGTSLIGAENLSPVTNLVGEHWRSVAVQFVSKAGIYHGAEF
jgi:hypothetical protein